MIKILNIILLILILIFSLNVYNYYSSSKNIDSRNFNRDNIDQIINEKISNLPVLSNDTDNVIIFNDSFSNKEEGDKQRSFWKLLKSK